METHTEEQDTQASTHQSLQHSITYKRVLARNLKNSLAPVNRLPDEILLACFGEAARDWKSESDGADERIVCDHICDEGPGDFEWSCTPVLTISHVSHRWRQLAIHMPALWTNLVITPSFGHLDVLREFLQRASGMPITANFRFCGTTPHRPADVSSMEATVLLLRTQQISGLSFLNSDSMLSSRIMDQPIHITGSPAITAFSHLTSLTIFNIASGSFNFTRLRCLLSATPQLKSLTYQQYGPVNYPEKGDRTTINLPKLENLKIIYYSPHTCKLLESLSAPDLCQLQLLLWISMRGSGASSFLFIKNNDNFDLKVPKFPKVWNLTLSWYYDSDYLDAKFLSAFPGVTHFMIRSPSQFYESEEVKSMTPPTVQWLRHLTLDFAFDKAEDMDPPNCFTWLPKTKDRADNPLLISVSDSSDLSTREARKRADRYLFRCYQALQQYGNLDGSSSRLDNFLRWQAEGEPEI
ncbi:hypothetical protein BJ138DRAFT_1152026 [Hygrophoropsis aurantiaca]|uniref:Uncharacterized protein n=1 Tax=Hygrophoropsis aurantiaca TaxID=72124 RepID=A0ACB8ABD2_9AGAM|nr:hypothetical protein BJ138DRAFT_1152026 [Hygrophoropsis aurantiaca]